MAEELSPTVQHAPSGPPLVSVVIPAYNCAAYLPRAIESVLAQDYPHLECLVVDDGSRDDTAAVAGRYAPRVRVISQANGGASAARNTGIAAAAGALIAFLDADDYWHPGKFGKQVALFARHPALVLVSTGFADHTDDSAAYAALLEAGAQNCDDGVVEIHEDFLPLFRDPYLGTPTVMVRTDRAREVGGFDTALPIAEDLDFYFRVCTNRAYARINQPLVYIHKVQGSLSHTQPGYRLNLEVISRLEKNHPEFARRHGEAFAQQRLAIYRSWISKCIIRGRGREARGLLRESSRYGKVSGQTALYLKSLICPVVARIRNTNA